MYECISGSDISTKIQCTNCYVFSYDIHLGVPHNGELPYVWGWTLLQRDFGVRLDSGILIDLIQWDDFDYEWGVYMTKMWANFAKYGYVELMPN